MINAEMIYKQIQNLTADLIGTGICDDQNFPNIIEKAGNVKEISIGKVNSTIFLKNIAYEEMYREMKKIRAFNMQLIDGAMILMQYRFCNENIVACRLSFFPSPNLHEFQNCPEVYLEDEIYTEVVDKRIVSFPIRFDFDSDDAVVKEIEHPKSHLTLGQYKNCRIPVSSAITPYYFLSFIIGNFYHTAYKKYSSKLTFFKDGFEETIVDAERELMYVNVP